MTERRKRRAASFDACPLSGVADLRQPLELILAHVDESMVRIATICVSIAGPRRSGRPSSGRAIVRSSRTIVGCRRRAVRWASVSARRRAIAPASLLDELHLAEWHGNIMLTHPKESA